MAIHVPRVQEITGKKPVEELRAEAEWLKARKLQKAGPRYGKLGAREAWKRAVYSTRSL